MTEREWAVAEEIEAVIGLRVAEDGEYDAGRRGEQCRRSRSFGRNGWGWFARLSNALKHVSVHTTSKRGATLVTMATPAGPVARPATVHAVMSPIRPNTQLHRPRVAEHGEQTWFRAVLQRVGVGWIHATDAGQRQPAFDYGERGGSARRRCYTRDDLGRCRMRHQQIQVTVSGVLAGSGSRAGGGATRCQCPQNKPRTLAQRHSSWRSAV